MNKALPLHFFCEKALNTYSIRFSIDDYKIFNMIHVKVATKFHTKEFIQLPTNSSNYFGMTLSNLNVTLKVNLCQIIVKYSVTKMDFYNLK